MSASKRLQRDRSSVVMRTSRRGNVRRDCRSMNFALGAGPKTRWTLSSRPRARRSRANVGDAVLYRASTNRRRRGNTPCGVPSALPRSSRCDSLDRHPPPERPPNETARSPPAPDVGGVRTKSSDRPFERCARRPATPRYRPGAARPRLGVLPLRAHVREAFHRKPTYRAGAREHAFRFRFGARSVSNASSPADREGHLLAPIDPAGAIRSPMRTRRGARRQLAWRSDLRAT